ncbi:flagellar biosynthesis anti-sigma factor FlgM [Aurantivibrio plasticivorans]
MVIDPNNRLNAGGSQSARNKAATGVNPSANSKASSEKSVSPETDSVQLSPEAMALKRLEAQINASPDIDTARVAAIKRAIAEGSFEINVERIAEKMLQNDNFLG